MTTPKFKIEELKEEYDKIKEDLNAIKQDTSKNPTDKQKEADVLKQKAEAKKQEIDNEISRVEQATDATAAEKQKVNEIKDTLNTTTTDIDTLYNDIAGKTTPDSPTQPATSDSPTQPTTDDKNFFEKSKNWIWNQWNDIRDGEKWKSDWWKNLLRTVWFVATWVWAVALAYKWVKKLWNWAFWKKKEDDKEEGKAEDTKEKESGEKKTFWDRPVWKFLKWTAAVLSVWTWAYYLAHWLYTKNRWLKDLRDWEKGKKLEFDEAMNYCEWALANQNNKDGMAHGMNLKYHEDTWEIEAYWERIKIDKEKRMIKWLKNVEFKKYEHMINVAILIAYLKKEYSWKCKNNAPFHLNWSWQWDINVNTWNGDEEAIDWTWNGGKIVGVTTWGILGIVSWIFGWLKTWAAVWISWWIVWYMWGDAYDANNIMHDHMPELDDDNWKKRLQAYLNSLGCRQEKNQTEKDITESPIKKAVRDIVEEIQQENPELGAVWWTMQFDAIQDPNDENKYTIKVYGREISVEVSWSWGVFEEVLKKLPEEKKNIIEQSGLFKKMKILSISWWEPAIKTDLTKWNISNLELPLKEWLYMTAFLGNLLSNYAHKWNDYPRFSYWWRFWNWVKATVSWIGNILWFPWEDKTYNRGIYFSDSWIDTQVLSRKRFEKNMPTLFKANYWRESFIKFLNDGITDEQNVSIRKK